MSATSVTALVLGIGIFIFPHLARAFWPFTMLSDTAQAGGSSVMPDGSLALLTPATNTDPNPDKTPRGIETTGGAALIADQGPEGTPPDTTVTGESNGAISLYVVRAGDTLSEIADMFGVSANTILWANNLSSSKDIHPGDTLLILPVSGIQHTVLKGETLAGLAKKYGSDAGDIASFNGLDPSIALTTGTSLIIPGGEIASSGTKSSGGGASGSVKSGGSLGSIQKNPYRGGSGAADNGYYGNPLPGGIITQGIHGWNGVDIGAKTGTPIYAAAAGAVIVSRTGGWNGGYGNYVVISHANGTQTLYAHMSSVAISAGASVGKGQLIGYVGRTGEATGPHLHFEVRGAANPFRNCAIGRACSPQ